MLYVHGYMLQIIDATLVFSSLDKIEIHMKHIPHIFLMKKRLLHFQIGSITYLRLSFP